VIGDHLRLSFSGLKEIIVEERVVVQFQSILSARNHSIIGFEGLIRGKTRDAKIIPPAVLFDAAREYGMTLELDRLCREKILPAFYKNIYRFQKNSLLFLNLETSFLSSKVVGSGYLLDQFTRYEIPPGNIIIEIVESKTVDTASLLCFVNTYRGCGLNIALDDVGAGYSNFDRISLLRPNIIKVDRSIISGMSTDYFKQEIFKSLANLSKNIGCLILAEGVETREEVLCSIEYGADLLQGYFFSVPEEIKQPKFNEEDKKLEDILFAFRTKKIDIIKAKRLQNKQYQEIVCGIVEEIQGKPLTDVNGLLRNILKLSDTIDAIYVVNKEGVQITDTIMKEDSGKTINPVFRQASKNENLSHKEYVYQLINTDLSQYTTDRYISFATGKLCVTLSYLFKGEQGRPYILCTDFLANDRN
jgi:EAL domain-containing protein (putative c-di-GMP-specific phosphodiesterase class I)